MSWSDKARFYTIHSEQLPSVTTILGVIDKSGPLMHWAANMERRAFESALLDVLTRDGAKDPDFVLTEMTKAVSGKKAFLRKQDEAAVIGTAAHALIEWHVRTMLGEKVGPEPRVPDGAMIAVEAWKDWAKDVTFTPHTAERTVHCLGCGYAGTLDWIAEVRGVLTLGDWKTGKAIYPEAVLQNRAYRHAAAKLGMPTAQGMILRLPKTLDDPAFEAMVVPDMSMDDFLAALRLWGWQRRMEGKTTGSVSKARTSTPKTAQGVA